MSQARVAEPDFTRAAIHLVEVGKMNPSMRLLRQIAQKTGRPISYFLASAEITPEHRVLIDEFQQLVASAEFDEVIRQGEALLQTELPREVEGELRFLVGRSYVRALRGAEALPHLARARGLYELSDDHIQLAEVLNQTACAYYLCDDSRSLKVANEALDACERLRPPQPELTVRTLIVIGMIYYRLQSWREAITYYRQALGLTDAAPGIRNIGLIHDHLAMSYQQVGGYAQALTHARKAMRFHKASLDPTDLFRAHQNLGEILLKQGELEAARDHLECALVLSDERELQHQARGGALLSLVELHLECDDLELAETHLAEAQSLVEQLGERNHQANAWRLRARLHLRRGQPEIADQAYTRSVRLYRELEQPADAFDVLAEHAAALSEQDRDKEAIDLYKRTVDAGRRAIRRVYGGWADVVAAGRGR